MRERTGDVHPALTHEIVGAAIRVHTALLLIDETVIVQVKSVAQFDRIHEAQLLTYLRLSGHSVGLLINFNVARLRDGIMRRVETRRRDKA